jgi:hypothetical protein
MSEVLVTVDIESMMELTSVLFEGSQVPDHWV